MECSNDMSVGRDGDDAKRNILAAALCSRVMLWQAEPGQPQGRGAGFALTTFLMRSIALGKEQFGLPEREKHRRYVACAT